MNKPKKNEIIKNEEVNKEEPNIENFGEKNVPYTSNDNPSDLFSGVNESSEKRGNEFYKGTKPNLTNNSIPEIKPAGSGYNNYLSLRRGYTNGNGVNNNSANLREEGKILIF